MEDKNITIYTVTYSADLLWGYIFYHLVISLCVRCVSLKMHS